MYVKKFMLLACTKKKKGKDNTIAFPCSTCVEGEYALLSEGKDDGHMDNTFPRTRNI